MIIFPGQGSQSVGMGKDLYDNFECAKQVFDAVDDALNQKLSLIIFNGSEADLTMTENTQPALMAVSMAILAVLKKVYRSSLHLLTTSSAFEYAVMVLCTLPPFILVRSTTGASTFSPNLSQYSGTSCLSCCVVK